MQLIFSGPCAHTGYCDMFFVVLLFYLRSAGVGGILVQISARRMVILRNISKLFLDSGDRLYRT